MHTIKPKTVLEILGKSNISVKKILLLLCLLIAASICFSQHIYKIKTDSLLVTNDSCTAELNLENSTRYIKGFLYNKGNGRTEFRQGLVKVNDSIYVIGADTLNVAKASSANMWKINGNTGTSPTTNFLGTTDGVRLVFRTKNTEKVTIDTAGNMGIGIGAPLYKLDVNGTTRIIGRQLLSQTLSVNNTFINGGNLAASGTHNIGIGTQALNAVTSGADNIALGTSSQLNMTTGQNNISIGRNTMQNTTTGSYSIAIGLGALANNQGSNNVAIGISNLSTNTSGYANVAIGRSVLSLNTSGVQNIGMGEQSLNSNTTGNDNIAFGRTTLLSNTTGHGNIGIGSNSLQASTTASHNISMGVFSMYRNTTGGANIGAGYTSLQENTTGNYNLALGYSSMQQNRTGQWNTSIGVWSLFNNRSGNYNIGIGGNTLYTDTSGIQNIAMGHRSLYSTTGDNNIGIGAATMDDVTTGSANISIGVATRVPNTTGSGQLNIGSVIFGTGLHNGTSMSSSPTTAGKIGIGVAVPTSILTLKAGSTSVAPFQYSSGTNLTTIVNGTKEYDGTNEFISSGGVRYTMAKTLTATATLDFGATAAGTSMDLTVTVAGATDGDIVSVGVPNASTLTNGCFTAWVSAANTATVRFTNNDLTNSLNPASGSFRVSVIKY